MSEILINWDIQGSQKIKDTWINRGWLKSAIFRLSAAELYFLQQVACLGS